MVHHLQKPGQVRGYCGTIVSPLRHLAAEHQDDWDSYVAPLPYASDFQELRSTKLALLIFVFSKHSPGPASSVTITISPDVSSIGFWPEIRFSIIIRAAVLWDLVNELFKVARKCYKSDYDEKIRLEPTCVPGDYILASRPPIATSAFECLAGDAYSESLPRRHRPYHVLSVRSKYQSILEEGIENSVSISCITGVRQKGDTPDKIWRRSVRPETKSSQPWKIYSIKKTWNSLLLSGLPARRHQR